MLDPKFVRQNVELVKTNTSQRKMDPSSVDQWLAVDKRKKEIQTKIDEINRTKNAGVKVFDDTVKEKMRGLKLELATLKDEFNTVSDEWNSLISLIPNMKLDDVPVGKSEDENVVIFESGNIKDFGFKPKDHLELTVPKGLIDFERGAKVSGSQFYYLQGDMVLLEMAVIQFILDLCIDKGYLPMHTPDLARSKYYLGTGYSPRGDEAQTYEIQDDDLGLIATAEVTMAGYHSDEILGVKDLPKKYIAISHCYRKEAGAYGKYSKGLFRVHQFTKLELFTYCRPEDSEKFHQEILDIEKEVMEKLKIPYRVVIMCTGDLGSMAAKKYDVEAWMPGRGSYGEVTSTSNCTDFQSRNLNIRFKDEDGVVKFAHMLNGTAAALSRVLIAIIENYQTKDGDIEVPEILRKYIIKGKEKIG